MRRLGLIVLLAATACTQHQELRLILAEHERILAMEMARADRLNDHRRERDALQARLQAALETTPGARAAIEDALREAAPPTTPVVLPPLPPERAFEGAEGRRLRLRIEETRARILALEKIVAEASQVEARSRQLTEALQLVEAHRTARP